MEDIAYYDLLSKSFPNIQTAATEIINLKAILSLPKTTEHFVSDIHGEYDAFLHILRSGSGVIHDKIEENFKDYTKEQKARIATIIYYPKEKLELLRTQGKLTKKFYHQLFSDLIDIARISTSKYTRSRVRKMISPDFVYITEELLQSHVDTLNKDDYYESVINTIIETGRADAYIEELAQLIQRGSVAHLHFLGDVYDRGQRAFRVMELLKTIPELDITWGNHDIAYMGAAALNTACIANIIRTSCKYYHLSTIEEGYAISLRGLMNFALQTYADDPCTAFYPTKDDKAKIEDYEASVVAKMHKAIAVIMFKLEGQLSKKHPNWKAKNGMQKLERIDFQKFTYRTPSGKVYDLADHYFPTIDQKDVYKLSEGEQLVMDRLVQSFKNSDRLHDHIDFLFKKGSIYLKYNENLLIHGCIPTDEDGDFTVFVDDDGYTHEGKDYLKYLEKSVRNAFYSTNNTEQVQNGRDLFYFLWCGPISPLFGKDDIITFEKLFLKKEDHDDFSEPKNAYYKYYNDPEYCNEILNEFGLSNEGCIINGHIPVKIKKGESPIKCGGKVLVIDGGISKAYHSVTGIAGYTLVYNSYGMKLIEHDVFTSKEDAIEYDEDIIHQVTIIDPNAKRKTIASTYTGKVLAKQIDDLQVLLQYYRNGTIKQLK